MTPHDWLDLIAYPVLGWLLMRAVWGYLERAGKRIP